MKLIQYIQDNWGWFTVLGTSIAGWIAHTNWSKVLAALDWIQNRGGLLKWLLSLVWNNNPPAKPVEQMLAEAQAQLAKPAEVTAPKIGSTDGQFK